MTFCVEVMSRGVILLSVSKYPPSKQLPDLKDAEAVQKFFLEEIQLGEELLAQGECCKAHVQPRKREDLRGFTERFVTGAASHLAPARRALPPRGGSKWKILWEAGSYWWKKEGILLGTSFGGRGYHVDCLFFLWGMEKGLWLLTGKLQAGSWRLCFSETLGLQLDQVLSLGLVSWVFSTSDTFGGLMFIFL